MTNAMEKQITIDSYKSPIFPTWCAGCGDFGIWASIKNSLVEQQIAPHEILFVYDIGCSGNMTSFVNAYGFHGLHGRAIPLAEGAAMANHKLPILVVGGDGGLYGEGMGHFIAACRANHNITVIVHNNMVYGLTTGQVSPTAAKGFKAKSTPEGVIDQPVNPIALALISGATFVARGFAGDQKHLQELITQGMKHNGFSLIDVFQPCVTFNKVNTYAWFRERVKKIEDERGQKSQTNAEGTQTHAERLHEVTNKEEALKKAMSGDPLWIGLLYESDESSYEQQLPQLEKETLVEKDISKINITELVREFRYFPMSRQEIVSLILEKDGKLLVEKRKSSKPTSSGKCIFPGGKVEPGESLEEAMRREAREEFGIQLKQFELVMTKDFDGGGAPERVHWFACNDFDGEIQNNEAEELVWIDDAQLNMLSFDVSREAARKYFQMKK